MGRHKTKQYLDEAGNLLIRPYRLKDLKDIFGVSAYTLKKWMSKHPAQLGEKEGKYYSIRQVEFMIQEFGLPKKVYIMREHISIAA